LIQIERARNIVRGDAVGLQNPRKILIAAVIGDLSYFSGIIS
jgi:hypothetical protein